MNTRTAALTFCLLSLPAAALLRAADSDPKAILLWPNGAPGSEGKSAPESVRLTPDGEHVLSSVHQPSITAYLPAPGSATGAAVIIAPGGGHSELWIDHEGYNEAKWLSAHGVAAFVLKYRLAREKGSTYTIEGNALADIQRALRTVRAHAADWGVKPDRVGVMGFSAGGEVAALAALRYHASPVEGADEIDRQPDKPAFQALLYPALPAERTVSKETPPAFLVCGENDRQNISQGLPEFYLALKRAGASAELHVFAGVGHGFGLRDRNRGPVSGWIASFLAWLDARGLLKP
jgi:endo-1,4-beta-xylanase